MALCPRWWGEGYGLVSIEGVRLLLPGRSFGFGLGGEERRMVGRQVVVDGGCGTMGGFFVVGLESKLWYIYRVCSYLPECTLLC